MLRILNVVGGEVEAINRNNKQRWAMTKNAQGRWEFELIEEREGEMGENIKNININKTYDLADWQNE